MTIKIAPSILSADFANLGQEIRDVESAACDYIHIDVMDGHFVPNLTIGPCVVSSIRKYTNKIFDVHLMIENVENYIEQFAKAGANIITFHVESTKDPLSLINLIKKQGAKAGISVKPGTSIEAIEPFLNQLDLVLIMTVEPGFGGQAFMRDQLHKINFLKQYKDHNRLDFEISVDGGINQETAKLAVNAGADILVAGAYIFNGGSADYAMKIASLRK